MFKSLLTLSLCLFIVSIDSASAQSGTQIFGRHSYYIPEEISQHYPYSIFSTIAFFAYDVNKETGSYNDPDAINKWRTTDVVRLAKESNSKVLLTLMSYGEAQNETLLGNPAAWLTLADSVMILLRDREADGVDIDFKTVSYARRDDFTRFVNFIRSRLGDAAIITVQLTYSDLVKEVFDLKALNAQVNTFILQGFDYNSVASTRRGGSLAPLYSRIAGTECIVNAVGLCTTQGLTADKIVLTLPLYGRIWSVGDDYRDIAYNDIVLLFESKSTPAKIGVDEWSESTFILLPDTVISYEGGESMKRKFRWAREHHLGGIGLDGLGYDGGRPEVWNAVTSDYGLEPVHAMPGQLDYGERYRTMVNIVQYRAWIGVALLVTICFFLTGLMLSLLDWRVRESLFRKKEGPSDREKGPRRLTKRIAKEFLFLSVALLLSLPIGLLFSYLVNLEPGQQKSVTMDDLVFEMELLLVGILVGFFGAYFVRLVVWAVKTIRRQQ